MSVSFEPLPWNWEQKKADFIKPGDKVLDLGDRPLEKASASEGGYDVVLSRGPLREYGKIAALLKTEGFFLMECVGSEDSRALASFFTPQSRPAGTVNLENQLPKMAAAGFRIMFRNQAYPAVRFSNIEDLRRYIALRPEQFPGFSEETCRPALQKLQAQADSTGFLENREHTFLLIGKKK